MEILANVFFVAVGAVTFAVIAISTLIFYVSQPYFTRLSMVLQVYLYLVTFGALFTLPGLIFGGQISMAISLLVIIVGIGWHYFEELVDADDKWNDEQDRAARIEELSKEYA